MTTPATFAIVGAGGWRAQFFADLARKLPEKLTLVGGVARRPETAQSVHRQWDVPIYLSPAELLNHQRPDFVISSVPWAANPQVVTDLVQRGVKVLCETPPAPDADGLRRLWRDLAGRGELVQVAEQYLHMPAHAVRRTLVANAVIGTPTSAQVCSTHGYHAVSMIRGFLGIDGFGPVKVAASRFTAPLVDPLSRKGWTGDPTPKAAVTTLATLDFGDGKSGLYDFTDNQWHNQLRFRRVVIRGSHGEIADDAVVRLADTNAIIKSPILRSQLGYDLNLDGYDTEHFSFEGQVLWRNPFRGLRLMDEEIAIASLMTKTGTWARDGGPAPYPLAQGCQDHLIGLAIEQAADSGIQVVTTIETWGTPG